MYIQLILHVTATPSLEFKNFPCINIGSLSVLCERGQRNHPRVCKKGDLFSVNWPNTKLGQITR